MPASFTPDELEPALDPVLDPFFELETELLELEVLECAEELELE